MEEVTIKNYQELAMRTCLPSAKNWEYCYCLIASEIYETFGKWGKNFRDRKLYSYKEHFLLIEAKTPHKFCKYALILNKLSALSFSKTFAEECGIDPLDCLKRNIAKLAGRQERGTLAGNGDER